MLPVGASMRLASGGLLRDLMRHIDLNAISEMLVIEFLKNTKKESFMHVQSHAPHSAVSGTLPYAAGTRYQQSAPNSVVVIRPSSSVFTDMHRREPSSTSFLDTVKNFFEPAAKLASSFMDMVGNIFAGVGNFTSGTGGLAKSAIDLLSKFVGR